jgi:hypothetical protein
LIETTFISGPYIYTTPRFELSCGNVLPLGELEPSAGAALAVLLAFHHPGVPGKETIAPKAGVITLVHLAESPGKAVTAGSGLAVGTAAVDIDQYVELVLTGGNHQRLTDHHGMFALGEIPVQILAVNYDFAASVPDIYPGYRSLPPSGSDSKILNNLFLFLPCLVINTNQL